ncbi:MAG TPA: carotenoid 1,2-hydratase [Burkholderiaceae bacterium]|nr:carotenoid 1,2-hydratase [Burkholderiaceae bacterium]
MNRLRRRLLAAAALGAAHRLARATMVYPNATPRALDFPRDFGAHLPYRIEWWYLTGVLDAAPGAAEGAAEPRLGMQLTFFRIHPPVDPDNPSRFAAHQLVMAHAAIGDPRRGALLHEERIARTGFGVAAVSENDTQVEVDRWSLARDPATGIYRGAVRASQFQIELAATPTQPLLLQGEHGYSRKGPGDPQAAPASFYYSEPQLALQARVRIEDERGGGANAARSGRGWLDHEWSSTYLPPQASGWDWVGFNLDDGSALTAFQMRPSASRNEASGSTAAWFTYASLRSAAGLQTFAPGQVRFEALQRWTSPRTRATYPVAQRIVTGSRVFETRPLMPDQELDPPGGFAYWEGASDLLEDGRVIGRGYLELTGYAGGVPATLSR